MTYGLFVLGTLDASGKPTGCVVNTVFQFLNEPYTIAVSVSRSNYTHACIEHTKLFSVSILSEKTGADVIGTFGFLSGRTTDKFQTVPYDVMSEGIPILKDDICGNLLCKVVDQMDFTEQTLFIAEVVDTRKSVQAAKPMTYAYYHEVKRGKTPKSAPSYREETAAPEASARWVCSLCGYEYDGEEGPFEELPDDWICPICAVSKSSFVRK